MNLADFLKFKDEVEVLHKKENFGKALRVEIM